MKMDMIGSDTEMFLAERKTSKIIPGHPGLIPGTKEEPYSIGQYASLQLDNVLAEVTFPPSKNSDTFISNVLGSRDDVNKFLRNAYDLVPVFKSSHNFTPRELATPWASVLGCKPDHAADAADPCEDVKACDFPRLRTGSGHIHVSLKSPATAHEILTMVRILDATIGASLSLYNKGEERRTMYGRAGRFRFKDYGFEYRAPDNYWYGHFGEHMLEELYNQIWRTVNENWSKAYTNWLNPRHSDLCRAINTGDKDSILRFLYDSPFGHLRLPENILKSTKTSTTRRGARLRGKASSHHAFYSNDTAAGLDGPMGQLNTASIAQVLTSAAQPSMEAGGYDEFDEVDEDEEEEF